MTIPCELWALKPEDLAPILGIVHDGWFSLSELAFDGEQSILSLNVEVGREVSPGKGCVWPFGTKQRHVVALQFFEVASYSLEDSEKIDRYDLNEIVYDEKEQRIVLTTGVPLGFEMRVRELRVRLLEAAP